jgi:hypothetical protein
MSHSEWRQSRDSTYQIIACWNAFVFVLAFSTTCGAVGKTHSTGSEAKVGSAAQHRQVGGEEIFGAGHPE